LVPTTNCLPPPRLETESVTVNFVTDARMEAKCCLLLTTTMRFPSSSSEKNVPPLGLAFWRERS
jgi:hypothetical protein